jgi:hypothetical protein
MEKKSAEAVAASALRVVFAEAASRRARDLFDNLLAGPLK